MTVIERPDRTEVYRRGYEAGYRAAAEGAARDHELAMATIAEVKAQHAEQLQGAVTDAEFDAAFAEWSRMWPGSHPPPLARDALHAALAAFVHHRAGGQSGALSSPRQGLTKEDDHG